MFQSSLIKSIVIHLDSYWNLALGKQSVLLLVDDGANPEHTLMEGTIIILVIRNTHRLIFI